VEVVGKAPGVFIKQEIDTLRVGRDDHKACMVAFAHTPDDLRVLVCRSVWIFLACQCDNDTRVILCICWQLIGMFIFFSALCNST
jgi:hypothetical protein